MEKCVTVTIWKLATPAHYWAVAKQFGMVRSAVRAILIQIGKGIDEVLSNQVLELCNAQEIIDGFARKGFPN